MRVSVVIPTYDRASLVQRALRSVLAQTVPPHEIIVVDDGSSDGTSEILHQEFSEIAEASGGKGFRVETQENRGVSAARNSGISVATGDWIALLDSDDEWLPTKLERQLAALAEAPTHRVVHCDEVWIRRGRRVNPRLKHRKAGGWIFEQCLPLCVISPSAVLLEAALLNELGGFDEALPACEDYDLWLRLCAREPVLFVDEALVVKHGGHEDQLSRRIWGLDRFRIEALDKALHDPELSADQRAAVHTELLRKLEIFIGGADKRGRTDVVEVYGRRLAALEARGNVA